MPRFYIHLYRSGPQEYFPDSFVLSTDYWDDYGYETKFHMIYVDSSRNFIKVGEVKIGFKGQISSYDKENPSPQAYATRAVFGTKEFLSLGSGFFSLGQSPEYYEVLRSIVGEGIYNLLSRLQDIANDKTIFNEYKHEGVIENSLLRTVSIWDIENQYKRIIKGGDKLTPFEFKYEFKDKALNFDIKPYSNPPTNMYALIGRNGVGKTTILNQMFSDLIEGNPYGSFKDPTNNNITTNKLISRAIYVSYSVFGSYVPIIKDKKRFVHTTLKKPTFGEFALKSTRELYEELAVLLSHIHSSRPLVDFFSDVMAVIDESYDDQITDKLLKTDKSTFELLDFERLSSGHSVVLLVIVNLIVNVREKTLILFDEPETHLHPPLLASLVRAINYIILKKNGICVFATHSPVLVQEIPRSCVCIVRRFGKRVDFTKPRIESFGENVSTLTHDIFSLEVENSGFYKLIKDAFVREKGDIDEVIKNFENQLGSEAINLLYLLQQNTYDTNSVLDSVFDNKSLLTTKENKDL